MPRYYAKKRLSFDEMDRLAEAFDDDIREVGIARSSDFWVYSLPEIQDRKSKNLVKEIGLVRVSEYLFRNP